MTFEMRDSEGVTIEHSLMISAALKAQLQMIDETISHVEVMHKKYSEGTHDYAALAHCSTIILNGADSAFQKLMVNLNEDADKAMSNAQVYTVFTMVMRVHLFRLARAIRDRTGTTSHWKDVRAECHEMCNGMRDAALKAGLTNVKPPAGAAT